MEKVKRRQEQKEFIVKLKISDFSLVNAGNQLQRLLFGGRLVPVSLRFPQEQRVEKFLEIPEALIKK